MKNYRTLALASTLCFALLSTACGSSNTTDSSSKTADNGVVLTAKSDADLVHQASTLQELIDDSDFIAKVKVTKVTSSVYQDTDSVLTSITPEILELYKGTYQGETLDMYGGYISYSDYQSAPIFQEDGASQPFDVSSYSEKEIDTAQVYWDWCNVYIPTADDTILYFGKQSDDNSFMLTNAYQGLFRLEGGNWTNQALVTGTASQQEPLVTDLLTLSGASTADCPDTGMTQTIDAVTYTYPKSDYDTMVSIPESSLITAIQGDIATE